MLHVLDMFSTMTLIIYMLIEVPLFASDAIWQTIALLYKQNNLFTNSFLVRYYLFLAYSLELATQRLGRDDDFPCFLSEILVFMANKAPTLHLIEQFIRDACRSSDWAQSVLSRIWWHKHLLGIIKESVNMAPRTITPEPQEIEGELEYLFNNI